MTGPKGNSSNPLKQVLDAVGETVECKQYDRVSAGSTEGQKGECRCRQYDMAGRMLTAQPGVCKQCGRQGGGTHCREGWVAYMCP